jgi:hypothetical protein
MVSAPVRKFLEQYVDSAELLDILMLLFREQGETWTPEQVSNRVFTVPQAAEKRLDELKARGLVIERQDNPEAYAVNTRDPALLAVMTDLHEAYVKSRADVINFVFSIKADPLKSFSDAFKLRGNS